MIIEMLYPEIASLYGEKGNLDILKLSFPEALFIMTKLNDEPYFAKHEVDLIVMGPTSEDFQKVIIKRLSPYINRIQSLVNQNVHFWITGNAMDIFGAYIEDEEGNRVLGLGMFDYHACLYRPKRFNSYVLGKIDEMEVVGFKSQFSQIFSSQNIHSWFKVVRGFGLNEKTMDEGFKINNFIGTQCLGPFWILNPDFTLNYFKELGYVKEELPYHKEMLEAYQQRVIEFKNEKYINYP
jgi:hypothetical protein